MFLKKLCKKLCPRKPAREVVLVFPFRTKEKEMLLIKEYIHHYDRSFWKFVSGGVDKQNTDNITHAKEELEEELGMTSEKLFHFHSSQRVFGARGLHGYIAENPLKMDKPPVNPDKDIITDTKWVNSEEIHRMIDEKELLWNEGALMAVQVFRRYRT